MFKFRQHSPDYKYNEICKNREVVVRISSYKVESVLRAYNKQGSAKSAPVGKTDESERYQDIVTLSPTEEVKDVYEKISYGLLDSLLHSKQEK